MTESTPTAEQAHMPLTDERRSTDAVWPSVRESVENAVNAAYGTDPRHGLLARAVADEVAFGVPLPWDLSRHFGMSTRPGQGVSE